MRGCPHPDRARHSRKRGLFAPSLADSATPPTCDFVIFRHSQSSIHTVYSMSMEVEDSEHQQSAAAEADIKQAQVG